MIRAFLKSLVVGLGAALVVGALWFALSPTAVAISGYRQPAVKSAEAIPPTADVHVETRDDIVKTRWTTHSDPYLAWVALATLVFASAWSFRRLRQR